MSPAAVAVLAGLGFAMAWLIVSISYSYFTDGDVSPSTLVGAAVAGTVFGVLNYLFYGRRS
jgi:Na+/H+ antiporter NhaA